jgi:hypothetical protein
MVAELPGERVCGEGARRVRVRCKSVAQAQLELRRCRANHALPLCSA